MNKKERPSHIYNEYLRDEFTPFVNQQLDTIWKPEHFDRIQHVLSLDNYYRQTDSHAAANRPKSRSTRHILLWLNEQSKLKQAAARRQSLITPCCKQATVTTEPLIAPSNKFVSATQFPQSQLMQDHSREPLPTRGKEIMGQVSSVIQDLSMHWKLKHVITKRFCKFLLRKKLIKPYIGDYQDDVEFDGQRYYFWNTSKSVKSANRTPRNIVTKVSTSVPNLDTIVLCQMRALIKSQREMIDDLKHKMSTMAANSGNVGCQLREINEEQSFHSSHREEADGNESKRKQDPELNHKQEELINQEQVELTSSLTMVERQKIVPRKHQHITIVKEIFYDVNDSTHSIRCRQDLTSKSTPRFNNDKKMRIHQLLFDHPQFHKHPRSNLPRKIVRHQVLSVDNSQQLNPKPRTA
ncbi:hypothetical protein WDU94_015388 [Cyamophila willieti]